MLTAGTTAQYVGTGVQAGGAAATAIGTAMHAAWVPIVGPALAAVTVALALWFGRKGPQQKVASTHIVDDLEPQLKANLAAYQAGPHTKGAQAQALANFDQAWAFLVSAQACGSPELGNPGRACIADRQAGGKWDWFSYYRDPIANDPNVRESETFTLNAAGLDPATVAQLAQLTRGIPPLAWLGVALIVGAAIL